MNADRIANDIVNKGNSNVKSCIICWNIHLTRLRRTWFSVSRRGLAQGLPTGDPDARGACTPPLAVDSNERFFTAFFTDVLGVIGEVLWSESDCNVPCN